MAEIKWLDALVQLRRMYSLLGETEDLSQQLAEALDRDDQVMVQMVLDMREEPVRGLHTAKEVLIQQVAAMADREDADRLRALLNGAAAQREEERLIADQVAANERLLRRVQDLDRVLNEKITREQSIYR